MTNQTNTRTLIYPEWLVDGTGAAAQQGYAVVVNGSQIEAIGPRAELPKRERHKNAQRRTFRRVILPLPRKCAKRRRG